MIKFPSLEEEAEEVARALRRHGMQDLPAGSVEVEWLDATPNSYSYRLKCNTPEALEILDREKVKHDR